MNYPQEIIDKLEVASSRTNQPTSILKPFYEELYDSLSDQTFPDDLERHRYAIQLFWVKHVTRPPVTPHTVIPLGYSKARQLKSGSVTSRLFVISDDGKLHPVILYDEQVEALNSLTLMSLYSDVALGSYSDNITYTADDRTKFSQPTMVESTPAELLAQFNFPKTDIKHVEQNLSKKITTSTSSFTDERDWRIIRGIIQREITSKEGIKLGYNVIDSSIMMDEPKTLPDGRKRNPGITIWMNEQLMSQSVGDECDFYGPCDKATLKEEDIGKKPQPEPNMNCFVCIKVHSKV